MSEIKIEQLLQKWRESVAVYAAAKAEAEYLYEFRKSKKALLMREYEAKNSGCPQWRAEQYAYAHDDYLGVLEGLKAATEKAEELRLRQKVAQYEVEVWRTRQANNRREQSHYGA